MDLIVVVACLVIFIVLLFLLIISKSNKATKKMEVFLKHAHEMSEELVPEVKGYETLLVQGSISRQAEKDLLKQDRLKHIATSAAIRIVTGNRKHLQVDLVNNSDYYVVRYHDENVYFFNVGAKFRSEELTFMGDTVYCFGLSNLASVTVKMDKVTFSDVEGTTFIFDLQETNQANGLLFTKENKAFKDFLKMLQHNL